MFLSVFLIFLNELGNGEVIFRKIRKQKPKPTPWTVRKWRTRPSTLVFQDVIQDLFSSLWALQSASTEPPRPDSKVSVAQASAQTGPLSEPAERLHVFIGNSPPHCQNQTPLPTSPTWFSPNSVSETTTPCSCRSLSYRPCPRPSPLHVWSATVFCVRECFYPLLQPLNFSVASFLLWATFSHPGCFNSPDLMLCIHSCSLQFIAREQRENFKRQIGSFTLLKTLKMSHV